MKPLLIQLPETRSRDGMTGIYWYSQNLLEALREFVAAEGVSFRKVEVEVMGRRVGGVVSLYASKWLGALPAADVVHAPHLTHIHRRSTHLTVHDLCFKRYPDEYRVTARMWRRLQGRVKHLGIVTPSHTIREELLREGFDDGQVTAAPLGVPAPMVVAPQEREKPYAVLVGELRPRKRSLECIQAFQDLDMDLVRVGPPMVGDAYAEECRRAAKSLGPRFEDLGYVTRSQLASLLAGASVHLYPSKYEGFGLPPLEAASYGTPSVVGEAEVFKETLAGLAAHCDGTPEGIAGAVEQAQGIDSRSLQRRAKTFTWRRCALRHLQAWGAVP